MNDTRGISISEREKKILSFWNENDIFKKSERKRNLSFLDKLFNRKKTFYFYDGPPFATGLPHFGHILPGTIKDVIPRYKTMKGYSVIRRWGWDCHGLPIEVEVEKELGIKSKKEIEELGIEKFNNEARKVIFRYVNEWKEAIPRFGRWVDMENDYRTLSPSYMESEWNIFCRLNNKGHVERGFKLQHICPRCATTLSNTEVSDSYKEITDVSAYVLFPLAEDENTFFVAWTTTPWTLLGNAALAIAPDLNYVTIEKNGKKYIIHESKQELIEEGNVIETKKGSEYIGLSYLPIFAETFEEESKNSSTIHKIYAASFVNADAGTGIVHVAPPYGEDDFNLAKENDIPIKHHVTINGSVNNTAQQFEGKVVKEKENHQEFDKFVVEEIQKKNRLLFSEKYEHSYPVCWRCSTPLLNYATYSWFIRPDLYRNKMIKANEKINWVPSYIGEKRFKNWLSNAREWSVSRARYWGTPIPVWTVEKTGENIFVDSINSMADKMRARNKYTFVRHAESVANVEKIISSVEGGCKGLSEKGKKDAAEFAKNLKEKPTVIFTSPFLRTKQTAEIVAKESGAKVIEHKLLKEIDLGDWNGKPYKEYLKTGMVYFFNPLKKMKGVETPIETHKRMADFCIDVDDKYENENIMVFTHRRNVRCIETFSYTKSEFVQKYKKSLRNSLVGNLATAELEYKNIHRDENGEVDIHRPYIDDIVLYDKDGNPAYSGKEVFDCWFESGSMPYASQHYPFRNDNKFDPIRNIGFPADFICEGLDQTRGWFYNLLAISVGAFNKQPFKNVVTTGLVLAEDGKKMSKSLKNYSNPLDVVEKYGADSLRHFLLASAASKGQDVNFKDEYVDEVQKKVYSRLHNCFNFYLPYSNLPHSKNSNNVLDIYILSRLAEVVEQMTNGFETYTVDKAVNAIGDFVDDFSTWYLRRSRERIRNESEDGAKARETMRVVLTTFSKAIAPVAPFYSEYLYQELKKIHTDNLDYDFESVHLSSYPKLKEYKRNNSVLVDMKDVRMFASESHEKRSESNIKVRQPLQSITVNKKLSQDLKDILADEINVKEVITDTKSKEIALNIELTEELRKEGFIREFIRTIQSVRKENKFDVTDEINIINIYTESELIKELSEANLKSVAKEVRAKEIIISSSQVEEGKEYKVNKEVLYIICQK